MLLGHGSRERSTLLVHLGLKGFPGCKKNWDDLGTPPDIQCPNQCHSQATESEALTGSRTGLLLPYHSSLEPSSSSLNQSTNLGEGFLLNTWQPLFYGFEVKSNQTTPETRKFRSLTMQAWPFYPQVRGGRCAGKSKGTNYSFILLRV